ncbi:MAG: stage III sporulation protein SpoIIIAB [Bacillota bacterium]
MLFKIVGSVIVVLSCSFIGFALSQDLKKRPRQLRELQGLLQMFENHITYLSDIIVEAFERISRVGQCETCVFFSRAAEILREDGSCGAPGAWERAVRECIRTTSLNKEDEEILSAFGRSLGNTDLEGQIKNIRLTLSQLKVQEEKAEENRDRNERMYKSLGLLGGAAIVILLL